MQPREFADGVRGEPSESQTSTRVALGLKKISATVPTLQQEALGVTLEKEAGSMRLAIDMDHALVLPIVQSARC